MGGVFKDLPAIFSYVVKTLIDLIALHNANVFFLNLGKEQVEASSSEVPLSTTASSSSNNTQKTSRKECKAEKCMTV